MTATILKVLGWVGVVLGALSMLESITGSHDPYAFGGGLLFFLQGAVALKYVSEVENGTE